MIKKLTSTFQYKPYFLVLLPLFFIINGYNEFFGLLTFPILLKNFLGSLALVIGLYLVFVWYFKDKKKASLFAFLLGSFFLTFGFLHDSIKKLTNEAAISSYKLLIPFFVFVFFFSGRWIKKSKGHFVTTFLFLNTLLVLFLLYEGISFVNHTREEKRGGYLLDNRFTTARQQNKGGAIPDSLKPDIYFLVFDAMPSTKSMQGIWGFDNSRLDSTLVDQGFYVAADSKSNYNITMLSVTSCMNMDYYEPDQIFKHGEIGMLQRGSRSIRDNSTTRILDKEGYRIQQFEVVSLFPKRNQAASFFSPLLTNHYLYKTLFGRAYRDLGWQLKQSRFFGPLTDSSDMAGYRQKRNDLQLTMTQIKQTCGNNTEPKFVYGHFMVPHAPYIFDRSGNIKPLSEIRSADTLKRRQIFCEQVQFASAMITELVTYIKGNNKKNTVIIVMGDHGYRNAGGKGYMIFDNLTAIYYPNRNYESLYSTISPVNVFRETFNKNLGTNLTLLPDSSIFIPYKIE